MECGFTLFPVLLFECFLECLAYNNIDNSFRYGTQHRVELSISETSDRHSSLPSVFSYIRRTENTVRRTLHGVDGPLFPRSYSLVCKV
jgi:hypothetical protein